MEIDEGFIGKFKIQIEVLKGVEKAVQDAIARANQNLKRIEDGEPIEKVFAPVPPKPQWPRDV